MPLNTVHKFYYFSFSQKNEICFLFHMKIDKVDILEMLIVRGADVNATDFMGNTPIHFGANKGKSIDAIFCIKKKTVTEYIF